MIRTIEPEENEVPARREHTWVSRAGWVEVIAGSMFSGKSEELIRRLRRAKIARQKVQVFKPEIDSRFSESHIVSHSEMRHESSNVHTAAEIRALVLPETEVVGIDEAQFFDNELIAVANELAGRGMRVIVAGASVTFSGRREADTTCGASSIGTWTSTTSTRVSWPSRTVTAATVAARCPMRCARRT